MRFITVILLPRVVSLLRYTLCESCIEGLPGEATDITGTTDELICYMNQQ